MITQQLNMTQVNDTMPAHESEDTKKKDKDVIYVLEGISAPEKA